MKEEILPCVVGDSIGKAYFKALELLMNKSNPYRHLTVNISQPFCDGLIKESPESLDINDWCNILNVGQPIYERFCQFKFPKKRKDWKVTGKDWINDRINALLRPNGEYYGRLKEQIEFVENRLKADLHGSCTNALVCQVFLPCDLEKACIPIRPNRGKLPCLTMLDFKPKIINKVKKLGVFAIYRSQFFDIKAYGNFISLAILLYRVCQKTKYEPDFIVSTANNAIFRYNGKEKKRLYDFLKTGKRIDSMSDSPTSSNSQISNLNSEKTSRKSVGC